MRIAFIAQRRNYFKFLGPLIQEAANRGWICELWMFGGGGGKDYLSPSIEKIPLKIRDRVSPAIYVNAKQLQELVNTEPECIVSLHAPKVHRISVPSTTKYFTLQHGLDTFLECSPEELASSNTVFYYSEYWLEWAAEYFEAEGWGSAQEVFQQLSSNAITAGSPQFDVVGEIDKNAVRKKMGIAKERLVILYLPLNLSYWPGEWPWFFASKNRLSQIRQLFRATRREGLGFAFRYWRWALGGWNDQMLTGAIRLFADKNNGVLLVKTRAKDPLRSSASDMADFVFTDSEYYPSTILELMAVADICIHSYSSAVFEAALSGAYGLCVDRPNLMNNAHRLWRINNSGHAFNFPGANSWMTIPQMITDFANWDRNEFTLNKNRKDHFIEKYVHTSKPVSPKILDHVFSQVTIAEARSGRP